MVMVAEAEYKLPKDFLYVLLVVHSMVIMYVLIMYTITMESRIAAFKGKFMS